MGKDNDSFVHLHVHSEYSMLDGAARVKPLVNAAVEAGMPAIAITDHGNMFGAYDFWNAATDTGIKPIIGTEAYLTPGTHRTDKTRIRWNNGGDDDVSGGGAYTHMTLLSSSTEGMHNLFKMSSLASLAISFVNSIVSPSTPKLISSLINISKTSSTFTIFPSESKTSSSKLKSF